MGDGGKGIIQVVFQEGVLDRRKKTSCAEFEIKMQSKRNSSLSKRKTGVALNAPPISLRHLF